MSAGQLSLINKYFLLAVVDVLGICSYDSPAAALREMGRVLRPGGFLLLSEHGVSDYPLVQYAQKHFWQQNMDEHGCDSTLCIFDVVRNALGLEMQDSSASSACTERARTCFSAPSVAPSPTTPCGGDCDQDHDGMKKKDGSTTTPSNVREKESPAVRDDGKACSFTVVFEQRRALGAYYHMIIRKDRI